MKFLKFKTLKSFYRNLILLAFLIPSFGGAGGGIYAQDPELFEHTWYFANGEINGDPFFPTENLTAEVTFSINFIDVSYPFCEGGVSYEEIVYGTNLFEITGDHSILLNLCSQDDPNELLFMENHDLIFGDLGSSTLTYYNPFSYTIQTVNSYFQLTIENGEGDRAVYNSVLLSTNSFNQNSFTIYPNPVKETLQINNTSNQLVTAKLYDISGKLLQIHTLENDLSTIDVKALKQGLYFVVFESENGEKVSKKNLKK